MTVFATLVEDKHPARMLSPMPVIKAETPPWWFSILGAVWSNPMRTSTSRGEPAFLARGMTTCQARERERVIELLEVPQDLDPRQAEETSRIDEALPKL